MKKQTIIILSFCVGILLLCLAVFLMVKKESFENSSKITIYLDSVGYDNYFQNQEKQNQYLQLLNMIFPPDFQLQVLKDDFIPSPYRGKINVEINNGNIFQYFGKTNHDFWNDLFKWTQILAYKQYNLLLY
jgi:hypothetical protein